MTDAAGHGPAPRRREFPVAWSAAQRTRHFGAALVGRTALTLDESVQGAPRRRTEVAGADILGVELHRWAPSPAVVVRRRDGDLVVELLLGGWAAAHDLAAELERMRAPGSGWTHAAAGD